MSADAKAWRDQQGWHAVHDGDCDHNHAGTCYDLTDVLASVDQCMGERLAWTIRVYPTGEPGLVGYVAAPRYT